MKKKRNIVYLIVILVTVILFVLSRTSRFTSNILELQLPQFSASNTIDGKDENLSDELLPVSKVGKSELKIDPQTTNIIIYQNGKKVGETLPGIKNKSGDVLYSSPLNINYKLTNTSSTTSMNAYDDSIEKGTYTIDEIENGVRVTYVIGAEIIPIDQIPQAIDKGRYESIYKNIESSDGEILDSFYKYSKEKDAYIRPPQIKPSKISVLHEILYDKGGYTTDDLSKDNKILDSKAVAVIEPISFTVPVEYTLTDKGQFNAQVIVSEIESMGVEQITTIDLLPGIMKGEEYFLVPDGSGAIIDINKNRQINKYTKQFAPISQDVLGQYNNIVDEKLSLPVFATEDALAIVDTGAEMGNLNVDLSGKRKLIYPSINYQYEVFYKLNSSGSGVNLSSKESNGVFSVIYDFSNTNQSYYQHAQNVQSYYKEKFNLNNIDEDYKINLEFLGSYNFTNYFLGVPYEDIKSLTTFEDVSTIMESLPSDAEYNLTYHGWANESLKSNILDTKLNNTLGKNKNLSPAPEEFSYSVNAVTLPNDNLGKFKSRTDAVYGIEGIPNNMLNILNSSFKENKFESSYYNLSPRKMTDVYSVFLDKFNLSDKLTINDLGTVGSADYKTNDEVLPSEAEATIMSNLEKFNESYQLTLDNPILERGFMADNITGLSSDSSNHDIFNYDVPFTQLVYNNVITTSNKPINLSDDGNVRKSVLQSIETRSNLDFVISKESTEELKTTEYDDYYATTFDYWGAIIEQSITEYDEFNKKVNNGNIIDHQVVDENITKVTYDNGYIAYFNYNTTKVVIDGKSIDSFDYVIIGGE